MVFQPRTEPAFCKYVLLYVPFILRGFMNVVARDMQTGSFSLGLQTRRVMTIVQLYHPCRMGQSHDDGVDFRSFKFQGFIPDDSQTFL